MNEKDKAAWRKHFEMREAADLEALAMETQDKVFTCTTCGAPVYEKDFNEATNSCNSCNVS